MPEKMVEWALGFFAAAWLGAVTLANRGQNKRIDNRVPRPEYEAEKKNINRQFDEVKEDIKEGIGGIHERLDKIFSNRRDD